MKKLSFLALLLLLFTSCSNSELKGKTLYLFNFNVVTLSEYQLKFISDDVVEVRTTLSANSFECLTYKNTPDLMKSSRLYHYSFKDGVLEMLEIKLIVKVSAVSTGYTSNTNEQFYNTSIVEVLDDKKKVEEIMNRSQQDNKSVRMYLDMLENNNEPLIIEENGKYAPNPKNKHNKIDVDTSETCGY